MGTFQKYSACAQWVLGGQIASELTMNSPCTHWVNAPSPPVLVDTRTFSILSLSLAPSEQAKSRTVFSVLDAKLVWITLNMAGWSDDNVCQVQNSVTGVLGR